MTPGDSTVQSITDHVDELLRRATTAYHRFGEGMEPPAVRADLTIFRGRVYAVLTTSRDTKAVYRLDNDGGLRRTWRVPVGLFDDEIQDRRERAPGGESRGPSVDR